MGFSCCGWFVACSLVVLGLFGCCAHGEALVPAVYVFGDSLMDVGNNNHLAFSLLKANYPHNGVDYPGHKTTGRFSNGKNAADFIAAKVGLPTSPPYLSLKHNVDSYFEGVSFASGGAGISNSTNKDQCLTLDKQIEYYSTVYTSLAQRLGSVQAHSHLSKSLFVVVIGSNDMFRYQRSRHLSKIPPQQYVDSLVSRLEEQLRMIYNLGARKFLVVGMGPIGCCPAERIPIKSGQCNTKANDLSIKFNKDVNSMLQEIAEKFIDMNYSVLDTSLLVLDYIQNPANYGFVEVKAACCGLGNLNAKVACLPLATYCPNRTNHIFWDFYHPTEIVDRMLIDVAFDGSHPHVFPVNVRELIAL